MSTLAPPPAVNLPRLAVSCPEALAAMTVIPTTDGPKRWDDPWPHQVELWRAVASGVRRVLVLKARQLGMTWALALLALWWMIAHPGSQVVVVSIGEREAKSVMRRVKRLYRSLPAAVRAAFAVGEADSTEQFDLVVAGATSTLMSLPSSATSGRGETIDLLIGDERPKWPNAAEQEASLMPAAADSGSVVMSGTANGMDSVYDRWTGAPGNGWHPIFVGALARPGRTVEWVMRERASLADPSLGPQELPLTPQEAFLASGRCMFDTEALQELLDHSCRPPEWTGRLVATEGKLRAEADERGPWRVWAWPEAGRTYLVAADVCGGGGGTDYSAAVVLDVTSGDQVASFHARPEPEVFAAELVRAGWLWAARPAKGKGTVRPALLVPEANNHGHAVCALLREWAYPNTYAAERFDSRSGSTRTQIGWLTTVQSKPVAVAALQEAVRTGEAGVRDQAAVGEMLRFCEDEHGRMQGADGAHDDRVMAWAIGTAVRARSSRARPASSSKQRPYRPRVAAKTGY